MNNKREFFLVSEMAIFPFFSAAASHKKMCWIYNSKQYYFSSSNCLLNFFDMDVFFAISYLSQKRDVFSVKRSDIANLLKGITDKSRFKKSLIKLSSIIYQSNIFPENIATLFSLQETIKDKKGGVLEYQITLSPYILDCLKKKQFRWCSLDEYLAIPSGGARRLWLYFEKRRGDAKTELIEIQETTISRWLGITQAHFSQRKRVLEKYLVKLQSVGYVKNYVIAKKCQFYFPPYQEYSKTLAQTNACAEKPKERAQNTQSTKQIDTSAVKPQTSQPQKDAAFLRNFSNINLELLSESEKKQFKLLYKNHKYLFHYPPQETAALSKRKQKTLSTLPKEEKIKKAAANKPAQAAIKKGKKQMPVLTTLSQGAKEHNNFNNLDLDLLSESEKEQFGLIQEFIQRECPGLIEDFCRWNCTKTAQISQELIAAYNYQKQAGFKNGNGNGFMTRLYQKDNMRREIFERSKKQKQSNNKKGKKLENQYRPPTQNAKNELLARISEISNETIVAIVATKIEEDKISLVSSLVPLIFSDLGFCLGLNVSAMRSDWNEIEKYISLLPKEAKLLLKDHEQNAKKIRDERKQKIKQRELAKSQRKQEEKQCEIKKRLRE